MKVKIGVSARHIHLTKEDFYLLFGEGCDITKRSQLNQPGEYSCNETVNIITEKGMLENVRIIGPLRDYTQVEISKTDSYLLGINPPVRNSGDIVNATKVTIESNGNKIERDCCIIANRHMHVKKEDLELYGLKENQLVKVKLYGIKGGTIDNVVVKASDDYALEVHIDLDDANAHLVTNGDIGDIIYE
jgi:putative phosphotransacetylase